MKRIEIDPSVHLANMSCALPMCQTHARQDRSCPPVLIETDGKHLAQGDSAGIADRWDLGFSQLGSTNQRGLGSFLWTWRLVD